MNELYYSVAAKRLDCDNTVRVYCTIQYNVIKTLHKMLDKMQLYLKCQIKYY